MRSIEPQSQRPSKTQWIIGGAVMLAGIIWLPRGSLIEWAIVLGVGFTYYLVKPFALSAFYRWVDYMDREG